MKLHVAGRATGIRLFNSAQDFRVQNRKRPSTAYVLFVSGNGGMLFSGHSFITFFFYETRLTLSSTKCIGFRILQNSMRRRKQFSLRAKSPIGDFSNSSPLLLRHYSD